jgi:hypothetical protein
MQCTLLIPDLWWPHGEPGEVCRDLALPELELLLARSRRHVFPAVGIDAWLCQAFEVERGADWPVAALTLEADGVDPQQAYWLRADPVHLRPEPGGLVLTEIGDWPVAPAEAATLIETLNRQFAADGIAFVAPCPQRWYVHVEADPQIATVALDEVVDRPIDPHLPAGSGALAWHRVLNEIQMLLHDHPVNREREARGFPPVNSVWLWGGGRSPRVHGRHFTAVWSAEPLAHALAMKTAMFTAPPPPGAEDWLHRLKIHAEAGAHHLLILRDLAAAARRADAVAWREAITELNRRWFSPLLAALRNGLVGRLALVAPHREGCMRFELARTDLMRVWRRVRPWQAYAPTRTR